ncbi:YcjF family protein [Atopobacter phocae]|uniref:YcjF family protein n=1 Tax=Atopobacter phocae TaxID=136492 RepID=UPI000471FD7B|nr:GTPase [Atopobacter phocae]
MTRPVDFNLVRELLDKTEQEVKKMAPLRIMVAGKTGVGKSTLINSLFRENLATTGMGQPVTQHLERIEKKGVPMILYDTRGLELNENIDELFEQELQEVLTENKANHFEKLHLVYYCINAQSKRIEPAEIQLIKRIASEVPVLLVITQSIGTPAADFAQYIQSLNLPIEGIFNVMAKPYPIYEQVTIPASGLKELVDQTFETIPESSRNAFTNMQKVDTTQKVTRARKWVKKYIYSSFGVGFTPIPFSDATLLVPMQVTMMAHITAIFGVTLDQATLTAMIGTIGGTTGATFVGRFIVSNIVKLVPGIGTVAGSLVSGATAASLTTALGYSYIEVLALFNRKEIAQQVIEPEALANMLKRKIDMRIEHTPLTAIKEELVPLLENHAANDEQTVSERGKQYVRVMTHLAALSLTHSKRQLNQIGRPLSQLGKKRLYNLLKRYKKKSEE